MSSSSVSKDIIFDICYKLFNDLKKTNIQVKKVELIKEAMLKDEEFCEFFIQINDDQQKTHISKTTVETLKNKNISDYQKYAPKVSSDSTSFTIKYLYEMVCDESEDRWSGNTAKYYIKKYILDHNLNNDESDILYNVISRIFHIGITITTLSKSLPEFFTKFNVAKTQKFDQSKFDKLNIKHPNMKWFISEKLDGDRLTVTHMSDNDDKISILIRTRSGRNISILKALEDEIKTFTETIGYVLDGELSSGKYGYDRKENFKYITGLLSGKDQITENFYFNVFDLLPIEVFNTPSSKLNTPFSERVSLLKQISKNKEFKFIKFVDQTVFTKDKMDLMQSEIAAKDGEGVILRADFEYENKRTNYFMKIKFEEDGEFLVTNVNIIDDYYQKATNSTITALKSVTIKLNHGGKEYNVDVGSGFNDTQKIEFAKNPNLILNKIITVKYMDISKTSDGVYSLRMPIFKGFKKDMV